MTRTTAVKDPVCGMDVETSTAAGQSQYQGQAYYFCGSACKGKFDLNPAQYAGTSGETLKGNKNSAAKGPPVIP